jgi:hypothetical protein
MNETIIVPDGSTSHANSNLLCRPAKWDDYVLFFLTNYVAHAATVTRNPGQGPVETFVTIVAALVFPVSGLVPAIRQIRRHARFEPDLLQRAARAGALCMVVRTLKLASEQKQHPGG